MSFVKIAGIMSFSKLRSDLVIKPGHLCPGMRDNKGSRAVVRRQHCPGTYGAEWAWMPYYLGLKTPGFITKSLRDKEVLQNNVALHHNGC